MKFNKLVRSLYTEAVGDLPPTGEDPSLSAPGARKYHYIPKRDPEVTAKARSKNREVEGGLGGVLREKLDAYRSAISKGYEQLSSGIFTPENEYQQKGADEQIALGMSPEVAFIFYLMGSKILRNMTNIMDLNVPDQDKLIPIFHDGEADYMSISAVARETLDQFLQIFDDFEFPFKKGNDGIIGLPYTKYDETPQENRVRLAWKELIDALRWLSGERSSEFSQFGWDFTTRQAKGSRNYFALDITSTATNWKIYTTNLAGKTPGTKLRSVSGNLKDVRKSYLTSDAPTAKNQYINTLPIRFRNGVPQYGQQLEESDVMNVHIPVEKFLDMVGHNVIWDIIYAKYVEHAPTFTLSNGETIDLNTLTISHYELTVDPIPRRQRTEKIAQLPPRRVAQQQAAPQVAPEQEAELEQ
jgi:hypothetical protein